MGVPGARWIAVGCLAAGCAAAPSGLLGELAEEGDAAAGDGGRADAGGLLDAGLDRDAGVDRAAADAPREAAVIDAGRRDTGGTDLGRDTGARDTGARDTGARDTGAGEDVGALPDAGPGLPEWDSATVAHIREVRARGASMGNRRMVFAKIGDSITESGSFLGDVGYGWTEMGAYGALGPTIRYFQMTRLDGSDVNSFNRPSECATAGWTAADALAGGSRSPLRRELGAIRPAWAIVMYGTNDIDRSDLATFRANINEIVDIAEAAGTVVVLSTIPDRNDTASAGALALRFNDAIREVTATRQIPLLDYWAAMQPLPSRGVSPDRIHPSVYEAEGSTASAYFTPAGLRYGYNVRNLTAILMLDRLRNMP